MKRLCIFLVRLYQKHVSPLKPPCCRYTPSCSAYAIDAFTNRGFFIGLALTVWRILRCNPFGKSGYDPVPCGYRFKRLDLLRKKMGEKNGESSVITEKKRRRKVMTLLPYGGHSLKQ